MELHDRASPRARGVISFHTTILDLCGICIDVLGKSYEDHPRESTSLIFADGAERKQTMKNSKASLYSSTQTFSKDKAWIPQSHPSPACQA